MRDGVIYELLLYAAEERRKEQERLKNTDEERLHSEAKREIAERQADCDLDSPNNATRLVRVVSLYQVSIG